MTKVVLDKVNKLFDRTHVIHDVSLELASGELIVFVGPSGCGKSTLLRLVAGLEEVSSGEIHFDGERVDDVQPSKRGVSMVFQSYALYPHMSVYKNMSFGLQIDKRSKAEIDERVRAAADILQLTPLLDRLPKQLSGGQRQRVAIGRAIVRQPRVFLFDEPLSNLDAALRVQMRIEIARLHDRMQGTTMIYVTHDQVEAMTLADRIVVLQGGIVEQIGSPQELYHNPVNEFVAGFIGSPKMNFLPVVFQGGDGTNSMMQYGENAITLPIAPGQGKGDTMHLGIRPEHITIADSAITGGEGEIAIAGSVFLVEQLGDSQLVYLNIGEEELLVAKVFGNQQIAKGAQAYAAFAPESCYLFDTNGKAWQR